MVRESFLDVHRIQIHVQRKHFQHNLQTKIGKYRKPHFPVFHLFPQQSHAVLPLRPKLFTEALQDEEVVQRAVEQCGSALRELLGVEGRFEEKSRQKKIQHVLLDKALGVGRGGTLVGWEVLRRWLGTGFGVV